MNLFTKDELNILFPNQIQRDIFIKGMNLLIKIITERTVNIPFIQLETEQWQ